MTLRLIDGFDYLGATTSDARRVAMWPAMGWSGDVLAMERSSSTAFGYGYSMSIGGSFSTLTSYRSLRGRHDDDLTHVVFGSRMFIPTATPTTDIAPYDSMTSTGAPQFTVSFTITGNIIFTPATGAVHTSNAWAFNPGRWFYFDMKWFPATGTDGWIEIRVNTVVVLSVPACATAGGTLVAEAGGKRGVDVMKFHTGGTDAGRHLFDDMYLLDSLGAVNNDYLGNVRVKAMLPVSDATPTNWTIGGTTPAATNWQSASNNDMNDTKFVYTDTPGDRDLYNIDPNLNTPYVYGIEVDGVYRQDDATQRVVRNRAKTNLGTNLDGADTYTNGYFTNAADIFETNPDTAVAFTGAEVNGMTTGPEFVS